jgi:anti-sigma factor RsiW
MDHCETHRALMLEYLYDLLEAEQRQALEAHLATCAACQAEMERSRRHKSLLATAARMEFATVRFVAPVDEPATAAPLVAPLPERAVKARPGWQRWAMAAAVLVALGAVAGPTAWYGHGYLQARQTAQGRADARTQAQQQLAQAQAQLAQMPQERNRRIAEVNRKLEERQFKAVVVGPASVPSGAAADYQIETRSLNDEPVEANLKVEVVEAGQPQSANRDGAQGREKDAGRAVVKALQPHKVGPGRYRVTVPPDLPVPPGSQPNLVVTATRADGASRAELREVLHLTAPVYLTHLATDKPMYQPGETVYFRSLTLDRASLKPAQEDLRLIYALQPPQGPEEIVAQGSATLIRGDTAASAVVGPDGKPLRGVGAGAHPLPENAPGGEWVLKVREEHNRFPEQRRKFIVNEYQKPRFDKELDYNQTTYGPGDEVQARCKVKQAGGGAVLKDFPVEARVQIDGRSYSADGQESAQPMRFKTDGAGAVVVRFKLPRQIERGQASLTVTFADEALVRTIPLVLKKLNVEFYPEGGYLVSGLPNRVYFQARTPLGKPADLTGQLLEDGKPLGVAVVTLHDDKEPGVNQGQGQFSFTPKAGSKYEIRVERPSGFEGKLLLPEPVADKVALNVPAGVVAAGDPISVVVHDSRKRSLMVGAYCRGRLLDSVKIEKVDFAGTAARKTLRPASGEGGVCRVTVFEAVPEDGERRDYRPVAERLIYRRPAARLDLKLTTDRPNYVPRQEVKLGLTATDEKGQPAGAVVMVAVADKSVLTMADEKTARSMPTHFLLTTEVGRPEDLEYADFLLGPHPKAAESLDLLLGTQGWRRFAEQDPAKFRQEHKEEAERLLVHNGLSAEKTTDFAREQMATAMRLSDEEGARRGEEFAQAEKSAKEAGSEYKAALAAVISYEDFFDRIKRTGGPVAAVVLLLAALLCLVVASQRRLARAVPYWVAATACAVAVVLIVQQYVAVEKQRARATKSDAVAGGVRLHEERLAPLAEPDAEVLRKAGEVNAPAAGFGGGAFPPPGMAPKMAVPPPAAPPPAVPEMMAPAAKPAPPGEDKWKEADKKPGRGGPPPVDADFAFHGRNKKQEQERVKGQNGNAMGNLRARRAAMPQAGLARGAPARGDQPFGGPGGPAAGGGRMLRGGADGKDRAPRDLLREAEQTALPPLPPLVVREYAHNPPPPADPTQRSDFTETVFWHPVLVLPGGKTEVSFHLSENVTSFEVTAFAHSLDGRLGSAKHLIESRLPLNLRPRTPIEVTAGDRVVVPVALTNNTAVPRKVRLSVTERKNLEPQDSAAQTEVEVGPDATVRQSFTFRPVVQEGAASVAFAAHADGLPGDGTRLGFRVVPEGFPMVIARSDLLESSATQVLDLPATWVKGTLKCQVNVYPSTLADLQKGLDALLREPCGCFEQTSTSNYPNLLILHYLKESDQARPEVERRARELLARGYEKLTSFECTDTARNARQGYEWFGGTAPAHEALTAYGLMEFRDMAQVYDVDKAMLERTRGYLLARRDGKGGFERNPRALDTFGAAPADITNAYIVWSLTEGGKDDDVSKELAALSAKAEGSKDPYFLALVANSLINRAKTAEGTTLLKKVAAVQKDDGHLDAETTSITHSGGRDLQIETTALAVLGWLKANPGVFQQPVQKAIKWIGQQRGGYGGFGSTQSTILALKALIGYAKANRKTAEAGTLELFVNDKPAAKLDFAAGAPDALTLEVPNAEETLRPGKNRVRLGITGKNVFPYTLSCTYQTLQPASADDCAVRLTTKLAQARGTEGESVRLAVHVENITDKGQGMAVAIVGLPGGLALPEDLKQLKEYTRLPEDGSRPLVSAFEVRGRELVLYWRDLEPNQKIDVPVDLVCRVPGEYSGPASRAYLYYNADHKHWVEPLKVSIASRAE